jgi:hypothetical protein
MALSPCSPCSLVDSPCSPCQLPFVPISTYLAPSSCDRNRPPPSQVACKLTLFAPPFTQLSLPLRIPRTPTNPLPSACQRRPWDYSVLTIRNTPFPRSVVLLWTGCLRRGPLPLYCPRSLDHKASRGSPAPSPLRGWHSLHSPWAP